MMKLLPMLTLLLTCSLGLQRLASFSLPWESNSTLGFEVLENTPSSPGGNLWFLRISGQVVDNYMLYWPDLIRMTAEGNFTTAPLPRYYMATLGDCKCVFTSQHQIVCLVSQVTLPSLQMHQLLVRVDTSTLLTTQGPALGDGRPYASGSCMFPCPSPFSFGGYVFFRHVWNLNTTYWSMSFARFNLKTLQLDEDAVERKIEGPFVIVSRTPVDSKKGSISYATLGTPGGACSFLRRDVTTWQELINSTLPCESLRSYATQLSCTNSHCDWLWQESEQPTDPYGEPIALVTQKRRKSVRMPNNGWIVNVETAFPPETSPIELPGPMFGVGSIRSLAGSIFFSMESQQSQRTSNGHLFSWTAPGKNYSGMISFPGSTISSPFPVADPIYGVLLNGTVVQLFR